MAIPFLSYDQGYNQMSFIEIVKGENRHIFNTNEITSIYPTEKGIGIFFKFADEPMHVDVPYECIHRALIGNTLQIGVVSSNNGHKIVYPIRNGTQ